MMEGMRLDVVLIVDHGGVGSDRMSDDSSKEAVSDSHPETLTDPEFSDPPIVTSSPPQSGDEVRREQQHQQQQRSNEKVHFAVHNLTESINIFTY